MPKRCGCGSRAATFARNCGSASRSCSASSRRIARSAIRAATCSANLYDFDPATQQVPLAEMQEVDRYALARYADVARDVLDAYDAYDFPGIFQRLNQLTTVDCPTVGLLRGRFQGSAVHVCGRVGGTALGSDGDVPHRGRPRAASGADPSGDDRRDVEALCRARAKRRYTWRSSRRAPTSRPC